MNKFMRFIFAGFARVVTCGWWFGLHRATLYKSISLIVATFATLIALLLPQQANSAGYTVDANSMSMTEMWWNPDESGWGAAVIHRGNVMFVAVYTYTTSGLPKWYVVSRCEVSGDGCSGDLYDVTGGVPLTSVWNGSGIAERSVGTFTMTFTDANNGVMGGVIDGVSWQKTISRELFGSVPCVAPQVANDIGNACVDPAPPASTCTAPALWDSNLNACVYPIGVKVSGANQLPQGCNSWKDQCWRDAVADGTVKWIATPATMTGYSTRPIVFAYFRNTSILAGVTGLWNFLPFYADDGSYYSDIYGGLADEVDWVYGTAKGVIFHAKSTGLCYEAAWDEPQQMWDINGKADGIPTTCPL